MAEKVQSVQSVERVLDIIEVLATEQDGLSLSEISKQVGLHKSTVHRLLNTLVNRGYGDRTEDGNYRIGSKLIEAVSCYINSLELQTESKPYLAKITAELGLTAHLGVLDGNEVVYVEKIDMMSGLKMYSQIGLRTYSYCSALGKCLLSNYSSEELEMVMRDCKFIPFTEGTITSLEALKKELHQVRRQGWAIDNEEFMKGTRCVGAPIYDYRGEIIASISASGSVIAFPENRVEEVAEYVKKVGLDISKTMGYIY